MRRSNLGVLLSMTCLACAGPTATAAPPQEAPAVNDNRIPGEYLVTLQPGADQAVVSEVYGRFGISSVKALGGNIFVVVLTRDPGPKAMDEARAGDARIQAVQPNYSYRAFK